MGCCGTKAKKLKSKTNAIKTENNILTNDQDQISKKEAELHQEPVIELIDKTEPDIHQEPITQLLHKAEPELYQETITQLEYNKQAPVIPSSDDDDDDDDIEEISPTDNISSIKTFDDLQTSVQENDKSISILLFYARYCPYSRRTIPDLRQWARINKDRIFLYEIDVEQASNLADYYHIRTIPTLMAFENNNLLVPIWQRTANNVLSSLINEDEPLEKLEQKQDIIPSQTFSLIDESNTSLTKSITSSESISSEELPYIWDDDDEKPSEKTETFEYNGRMISQTTISNGDYLKERIYNKHFDDTKSVAHDDQQYINLPNSNEIFYHKQYDNFDEFNYSLSSDRFSTITYQDIKDKNQEENLCILYHGPNRYRGFEDNLPNKLTNSSKLSLLTLKSHLLSE